MFFIVVFDLKILNLDSSPVLNKENNNKNKCLGITFLFFFPNDKKYGTVSDVLHKLKVKTKTSLFSQYCTVCQVNKTFDICQDGIYNSK